MDKEALQAFLAKPNEAIIAVNRAGKGAQLTPVWFFGMTRPSTFRRRKRPQSISI